jgi:hypothetical protein
MCSLVLLKIKSNLVQGLDRGKPAAFNVTVAAVLSSILCKEAQCAFSILGRALHAWQVLCRTVGYICMCIVGVSYASMYYI